MRKRTKELFVIVDNNGKILNTNNSFVAPKECSKENIVVGDFNEVNKRVTKLIKNDKIAIIESSEWANKFYGNTWGFSI